MRLIRLAILLGGCFLAASATWADDLGYVDCSNYPDNTRVVAKAAKTEEVVTSLPCGERFTILASGSFFTKIQTKDGKTGYVQSYLVSRDEPATPVRQLSPAPAAANSSAAPPLPAARSRFNAWAPRASTAGSKQTAPPQPQPAPVQPAPAPAPTQAVAAQTPAPSPNVQSPNPTVAESKPAAPKQAEPAPAPPSSAQTAVASASAPARAAAVAETKPAEAAKAQLAPSELARAEAAAHAKLEAAAAAPVVEVKPAPPAQPQPAPAPAAPARAAETPEVSPPSDTVVEPKPAPPVQPEPAPSQPVAEAPPVRSADWGRPIPSLSKEPMAELFGGYSYLRLSGGTGYSGTNIHGALGSFGWNFRPWLQLVADTSYNVTTISGTKNVLYGNHYGPRIYFRPRSGRGATPFVEGLFGGSRLDTTSSGYKTSVNGFSFKAGGGLDWKLSPHITIRVINADYYRTSFSGTSQNNYSASTGFILRLLGGGPQ